MNGDELRAQVSRLETFPEYSTALNELTRAKSHLSTTKDEPKSSQLRAELAVEEAREALAGPRSTYRSELATTDSIDAPYRIGMLAAMDSPPPPTRINGINLDLFRPGRLPWFNDDITAEDYAHPPDDRFKLAAKIGMTITELGAQFKPYSSKPLAVLSIGRMRANKSHPTEVDYYVSNKRFNHGLEVESPEILPDGRVKYSLPLMPVVRADFSPVRQRIVKKSDEETFIHVPALEQLTRLPCIDPQKLLVGRAATKFARMHYTKRRAEDAAWQRRNKDTHPLDRRYN